MTWMSIELFALGNIAAEVAEQESRGDNDAKKQGDGYSVFQSLSGIQGPNNTAPKQGTKNRSGFPC